MSQVSQQEWDEHILSVRPYDNQSQQLCPFFSILNTLFYQLFQHQQKLHWSVDNWRTGN